MLFSAMRNLLLAVVDHHEPHEEPGHSEEVLLRPVFERMIVAAGTLQLRAQEDARHGRGGLFRGVAILHVEQLGPFLLGRQQVLDDAVVRFIAGELASQPFLEAFAFADGVVRGPAKQHQIPDVGLLCRVTRILQQGVDELFPLLWIAVLEKLHRLVIGRDNADKVEVDAAQKDRIGRLPGRLDLVPLPGLAHFLIDDLPQRPILAVGKRGGEEQRQYGNRSQAGHRVSPEERVFRRLSRDADCHNEADLEVLAGR